MIGDWRAHVEILFEQDLNRLYLEQRHADGSIALLGADGLFHTVPEGQSADFPLPLFPFAALQAIAAAVKPGATQETIDILRESLTVERDRVDRILGRQS